MDLTEFEAREFGRGGEGERAPVRETVCENPRFTGDGKHLSWISTHPPTAERVELLRAVQAAHEGRVADNRPAATAD